MSTAVPSYILVIDLTGEKPRVLRRFDHHRIQDSIVHHNSALKGRALKGIQGKAKINGVHVNGDVDTEMVDVESQEEKEEDQETGDEERDSDGDEEKITTAALISVDRMAVSADGQWLVTSDNQARTHIFNLDSISVGSSNLYPTFYPDAISLASLYITFFPPICSSSSFRPHASLHSPTRLPRQHYPDI
jgi:U3 small nucleolar RNA-associated protein 4